MKKILPALLASVLCSLVVPTPTARAQGTALTYQGRLNDAAGPANGTYNFQFTVRDALMGGLAVGVNPLAATLAVSNGLFTATLDPGAGVFTGVDRWLEIAVKTNGAALFTTLSPRQPITATPYAITAGNLTGPVPASQLTGTLPSALLSGTYANALTLNNGANSFSGNGAGLTALNASQLASGTVPAAALSNAWKLAGNTGANPANGAFLGTTDTNALEFKVNNQRGLRLEPTGSNDTVNVIGGSGRNSVGAGKVGATIGGGGSGNFFGVAYTNRVEANFGTLSGGLQNTIQTNAFAATIGGGYKNTVLPNADYAAIGGGSQNTIQPDADYATIGGGYQNTIEPNAYYAAIGGGSFNTIQPYADYATIPGGRGNSATNYALAAGRRARANHTGAFVWADSQDADFASTGSNQFLIRAAGNVGINKTNPATALDVNGTVTATNFSGNGAGLTNVTALTLDGLSSSNLWKTTGNAGANPTNGAFLGTTDTNALELKVNNQRALRLEPTAFTDTVNVIGGSARNFVGANVVGATISGGGSGSYGLFGLMGLAYTNRVEADFGTVSGGFQNTIQTNAGAATISGGFSNTIANNVPFATIGGGYQNTIQTNGPDFGGFPRHKTVAATIGGGSDNTIQPNAPYATIPGGRGNSAGEYAFAAGRRAKANHTGAFVWADSTDDDFAATADNQFLIRAAGNVGINQPNPATALDVNGTVTATSFSGAFSGDGSGLSGLWRTGGNAGANPTNGAFLGTTDDQALEFKVNGIRALRLEPNVNGQPNVIGGGPNNNVGSGVEGATIGGGVQNTIETNAHVATIGGGDGNRIRALDATIGGGHQNSIHSNADYATVGGGNNNWIQPNANTATIGGGVQNTIQSDASSATIGGGYFNTIQSSADYATIPGGRENSAGNRAFAAGNRAKANHTGAFVWGDATDANIESTDFNSVTMRASGGYRLFSNSGATAGVSLAPGGTSWAMISDRNVKKDFAPVDQRTILEKLAALPITQWHYQWESPDVTPHIGPMAQDFKAAFYPGTDDKTITTQEADGVALAAIQGLNQKVDSENAALRAENAALKQRLEKLEQLMNRENGGDR